MKKKSLLLILLMALIAPWAANAQTLTVHDGSGTNNYVPFYGYYADEDQTNQMIYPATELADMNGKAITEMVFYWQEGYYYGYYYGVGTWTVSLGETTATTLSGLDNTTSLTPVFTGVLDEAGGLFDNTAYTLTIAFDDQYVYGGGNLLVQFSHAGTGEYEHYVFEGESVTGASYCYDSQRNFLPKTTFSYSTPSSCAKPENLALNYTEGNPTATVTWESTASNFNVDVNGTITAVNKKTYTFNVDPATTYTVKVQADCGGGELSGWASTSFFSGCTGVAQLPYSYGFENADEFNCWTVNATGSYSSYTGVSTNYPRTGTNSFMFFYTENPPQYLISPEFSGYSNGLHVEFWYRQYTNGVETFKVGYSSTTTDDSAFTWGEEITASTTYQRFSANYPVTTKYVAVKHTSNDQYYLFLDDFLFEESASCLEPTNVVASNETTTGATLNWTAGGEETMWDIYVTDDATVVPNDGTTPTYANISTKPYPLTPLTPATTYYVYVRAACSSTETSAWSSPGIFHTECEGMDLPYGPYGFEDGALSVCWNVINTNTSYNSVTVGEDNANTGTHSLNFYRGSDIGDLVAVLPEVGAYDLSDYQFEFSAKGSYAGYEIYIGIMTDPDDLTTFVAQGDVITTTTSYAEHKVRFNEYTGSGKYVAIKVVRPSTVTYGSIYVDDIAINPLPSCIEPSGLAVSDETAHGATFSWTNGGSETEWHLYFGKNNTAPADDIDLSKVTVANSNPFTMTTGLDPETDYYVWVRANCGNTDGYSEWVGPKTFTTGVTCPAPTGLTASEVTNHTAKLSWTGTSESYNVWYRTAATMSNPIFSETFETSSLPTGWGRSSTALTDDVLNGTTTINSVTGGWFNSSYGLGQYNWKMNIYSTNKYWLITPSITLDAKNTLNFDAAITAYNSNNAPTSSDMADGNSRFVVLITTDNQATWTILREWNNTGSADVLNNISNTGNNFSIDLTAYAGETVKIAFYGGQTASGPDCDLHIDNVLIGTPVAAGDWTKKTADASPYVATGLLAETKYEAQVQGNCGSEGLSQWTASVFFTTDIACPAPSGLTASNPKSNSFDLQWTNGGSEDWIVAYKKTTDTDFTEVGINMTEVTEEAGTISYTLSGLDPETDYIVKVRDNCEASYAGDGVSEWTAEVPYSTIAACSALNPVVDPASITHHNATVTWEGESATGFTVNYRTAESPKSIFFEGFETYADEAALEAVWTVIDLGDGANTSELGLYSGAAKTDDYGFRFSSYNKASTTSSPYTSDDFDQYLISPELTVNGVLGFAYKSSNGTTDVFRVGYSSTTNDLSAFTWGDQINSANSWETFSETMPAGTKYFAINYMGLYAHRLYIDDINIYVTNPAGAWQTEPAATTTANLSGLTAGTMYDVKIVPNCDETLESATVQFTTLVGNMKYFLTAGEWGTASNWMDEEIPLITDNATIRANVTIAKNYVAYAHNITRENSATITIKDGGELYHSNAVYSATMEKEIVGATTWGLNQGAPDGWYVICNPLSYNYLSPTNTTYVTNLAPTAVASVPQFDLYKYSESNMNWYSYNAHSSSYYLTPGIGFLYSRNEDAIISFMSGTSYSLPVADVTPSLTFTAANGDMAGWNLLGNPFSHSITWDNIVATNVNTTGYYKLSNDGAWTADPSTTTPIKPMEGFLVKATAASPTLTIKNAAPSSKGRANDDFLAFTVANSNYSDITYAMFSDGEGLEKINHRNTNVPMVYIPQDGERYAIATMGDETDMFNLNFKAMTTGKYALSYKAEGSYDYLHVIDRITGEDVDMLIDGEYSFMASAGDNENRFIVKLRYNANGNFENDIFAYQNGDEIIVSGEGELQIFDVMGRFVTSMRVNGSERISAEQYSNAVYIFRLVGNDVKTQKIVVR